MFMFLIRYYCKTVIFHISLGLVEQPGPINVWKIMQREEEWSLWVDTLDTGDRILDNTHYNTLDTWDRILDIILDNAHYNTLDTWDRMLDDTG